MLDEQESAKLQWGRDQHLLPPRTPAVASMGPRSIDRGNELARCCNLFFRAASMGPRSIDRGNAGPVLRFSPADHASMGPRSIDRGNGPLPREPIRKQVASMGPRSIDRGNTLARAGEITIIVRLQWGRDQLIAETKIPWTQAEWDSLLQWGRDQLIAETHPGVAQPDVVLPGASMGPRSIDRGNNPQAVAKPQREAASMGPRSIDRGN